MSRACVQTSSETWKLNSTQQGESILKQVHINKHMACCILLNEALSVSHTFCFICLCAVVALRQVQRQVEREREQMKEAEREKTEHTHKQITHLQKQLKHKDKDRNLLLVSDTHTLS